MQRLAITCPKALLLPSLSFGLDEGVQQRSERIQHGGIFDGGWHGGVLALGHRPQRAPQDLARARLRQLRDVRDVREGRDAAHTTPHKILDVRSKLFEIRFGGTVAHHLWQGQQGKLGR